jgi:hypothetical protein
LSFWKSSFVPLTHSHIHSFIDHIYINVCMDTTGCGI